MSGEHVRDQDWHARTGRAEEMSDLCRIKVLCYRERGPRACAFSALRQPSGVPRAEARKKSHLAILLVVGEGPDKAARWLPTADLRASLLLRCCCRRWGLALRPSLLA